MTSSAPGAGAQQEPPVQLGDGGAREGRLNRRATIWAALITAAAAIAGTLLGVYLSQSPRPAGPQVGISSILYPMVNGRLVIEVRGTVEDLGAGENVYAFAGKQAGLPPWYPGGPAAISGGLWMAEITGLPASGGDFSVWAGVASPPPSPGPSAAIAAQKHELAVAGPHALVLMRVSRPRDVVLPPG